MNSRTKLIYWFVLTMYIVGNCLVSNFYISDADIILLIFVVIASSFLSLLAYGTHRLTIRIKWHGDRGAWKLYGIGLLVLSPILLLLALMRDNISFSFGSIFVVLIGFAIFMANKREQKSIELRKEEENSTDG